jgi:hypothetical protein
MMWEIINFVKCQFTIIMNWLPLYKIVLFSYLALPIYIMTFIKYKYPHIHSFILSISLFIFWLIQILIWNKGALLYYK